MRDVTPRAGHDSVTTSDTMEPSQHIARLAKKTKISPK